jgi:hypothetical protein
MAARIDQGTNSPRHGHEVDAPPRHTSEYQHTSGYQAPPGPGLPETRRSYVVPLAIAIAVFVVLIAVRTLWGMMDNPRISSPAPAEAEAPTDTPAPSP